MKDGEAGYFNKATGTLMINANAKNKYFLTAVHESIHAIRTIHPESYNKLSDIVYEVLSGNESSFDKAWNKTLAIYKKEATKDGKLNRDLIDEELTAKVVSHLLTDESYIKELAKTNRNAVQRIYDAIVDLFEKIFKRYSENATPSEVEFKDALKELQSDFNSVKAMYENTLKETTNVQQSKIVLPKSGDGADVLNSKESLTDDLEDDNIKSSKGGQSYGQTTNNGRGTGRVSAESGNKRGRDSGNKRNVPTEEAETSHQISDNQKYRTGVGDKKSGLESLVRGLESSESTRESSGGWRTTENRRFQQAIENNDIRTAVEMLDNYAEKNGYFPLKMYHGTKSKDVFTIFRKESPIWVTGDNDYANAYVLLPSNLDEKQSAKLHTYKGSNVYELYVKMSKILDLGNIEEKIDSPEKLKDFCAKMVIPMALTTSLMSRANQLYGMVKLLFRALTLLQTI